METLINTNKLEEKIELTKKLELHNCHKFLVSIKEIVDMKFPITTWEEVRRKVWKQGFKACWHRIVLRSAIAPTISLLALILILFVENSGVNSIPFRLIYLYPFLFIGSFLFGLVGLNVEWKWLGHWKENIPYGALLAVDEAIAKGIKEFKIFYPVLTEKLSDPILIGHTECGYIVEIFNWDDGKIYE